MGNHKSGQRVSVQSEPSVPPHPGDKGLKGIGISETNLVLSAVADAESLKNHDILPMCA